MSPVACTSNGQQWAGARAKGNKVETHEVAAREALLDLGSLRPLACKRVSGLEMSTAGESKGAHQRRVVQ